MIVIHRGHELNQQQLDALVPVLNRHMHGEIKKKDLCAEFDKALEAAGCPVVLTADLCTQQLLAADKAAPRTCEQCGLGPCLMVKA